jgi:hypothetical protein
MKKYGNILSEHSPDEGVKRTKHSRNHTISEEEKREKITTTDFSNNCLNKERMMSLV